MFSVNVLTLVKIVLLASISRSVSLLLGVHGRYVDPYGVGSQ